MDTNLILQTYRPGAPVNQDNSSDSQRQQCCRESVVCLVTKGGGASCNPLGVSLIILRTTEDSPMT
jgi:hypothetical protein